MKIIFAILGYVIGLFCGITILAGFATASGSDAMSSSFVAGNIVGIICAIVGYNIPKSKKSE